MVFYGEQKKKDSKQKKDKNSQNSVRIKEFLSTVQNKNLNYHFSCLADRNQ